MKNLWIALGLCVSITVAGCGGGPAEIKEERLTVGKVQGEIKVGMAASQVAELLGSPNIVTTDEKRREVWMYDKVSTDRVDTSSSSFAGIIILGGSSRLPRRAANTVAGNRSAKDGVHRAVRQLDALHRRIELWE